MELILWRHAEAEESMPDRARKLTQRGHKHAGRVAEWLQQRLPAKFIVIASPAERTRQTAAHEATVDQHAPECWKEIGFERRWIRPERIEMLLMGKAIDIVYCLAKRTHRRSVVECQCCRCAVDTHQATRVARHLLEVAAVDKVETTLNALAPGMLFNKARPVEKAAIERVRL